MTKFEMIDTPKGEMRLFDSFSSSRLIEEGETYQEYKIRRGAVNRALKGMKKGKTIHVSSVLIPKMNLEGEVEVGIDKRPIWVGKSKGTSYVKSKDGKEDQHMSLVEHFKTLKNEQEHGESDEV